MSQRLLAYGMLTHHALNELYTDADGCCLVCCAPCGALKILDEEGVLDSVVLLWDTYADGTKIFGNPDKQPSWWKDGKVDREWLYLQWSMGTIALECH